MYHNQPIGLFDSGVGGTSIWREVHALMPGESTIYLADSMNAPYGEKPQADILKLSQKNTELLLDLGCKIIVVACNTATTNAIAELRAQYRVPFIGIEPAIKPAALQSNTKAIGILATQGTLSSALFHQTAAQFTGIQRIEQIGHGLVPLIEAGKINSPEMTTLLQQYLAPMLAAHIDHLVLGCSHYPYLIPILKQLLPPHVRIIDSGEAVARQTQAIIAETTGFRDPAFPPTFDFFTNHEPAVLQSLIGEPYVASFKDF
jgi:glutamate racemase